MSSFTRKAEAWNRRLHFYLGLYFLLFLWLFSLTGLLLNHGRWAVSLAANARTESRYERHVDVPAGAFGADRVRTLMDQLGLIGEIDLPAQQPGVLAFNVSRPSDSSQVRVDLQTGVASVQHFDNGHLARFRILHTFSGSRYNQPSTERDWAVTKVWVFAMDALAAGLIAMVSGSYYMCWQLRHRRLPGLVALALGALTCAWFVSGMFPQA
jgi:hypothetical protein